AATVSTFSPESPQLPPADPLFGVRPVDYQEESRKSLTVARTYDSLIIDLQTIELSARRIDPVQEAREERIQNLYASPNRRVEIAENAYAKSAVSIMNVLRQIPGLQLRRDGDGNEFFQMRNSGNLTQVDKAAVFLNGQPVSSLDFIKQIQVPQVEFIDVVSGQRAVTLGPIAVGGAIFIYLKEGAQSRSFQQGVLETVLQGYATVREFATFDASLPENRNRPDIRTTIHWAPLLRTDANGSATTNFTTSDQTGEFLIFVQGLRRDGTPVYGEGSFSVEGK
ncbi:MAG: TonB-dependent receptor plug domain-containing protein, partial [Bacteroidota bacterium]